MYVWCVQVVKTANLVSNDTSTYTMWESKERMSEMGDVVLFRDIFVIRVKIQSLRLTTYYYNY